MCVNSYSTYPFNVSRAFIIISPVLFLILVIVINSPFSPVLCPLSYFFFNAVYFKISLGSYSLIPGLNVFSFQLFGDSLSLVMFSFHSIVIGEDFSFVSPLKQSLPFVGAVSCECWFALVTENIVEVFNTCCDFLLNYSGSHWQKDVEVSISKCRCPFVTSQLWVWFAYFSAVLFGINTFKITLCLCLCLCLGSNL